MTATALSGGMLAALLIATPALAQEGGAGGAGGYGNFGSGGNGGAAGQPGEPASCGPILGGAIYPDCTHPGGGAGTAPGGSGSPAGDAYFNPTGGGGGGAAGSAGAPIGGDGGNGGNALDVGNYTSGGGGGGGGGNGLILSGSFVNSGQARGGRGGNGGMASPGRFDAGVGGGGGGGEGGAGIVATAGATIFNEATGSIAGGNGGAGGAGDGNGGPNGAHGAGGVGIRGAGIVILNAGSIFGGMGGDGVTRAYALHFTGSGNTLGLLAGGSITGGIQIDTGAVLGLEVSGSETLDNVISGDGSIVKTGIGTLILSGTNTYTGTTTLSDGTLQIGDAANISSNTIVLNAGTLRTTFDGTLGNALDWGTSGAGTIAAAAGTAVTLTGTINASGGAWVAFGNANDTGTVILANAQGYSANTIINGGTLQLDDLTGFASNAITLNAGTLRTAVDGTISSNLFWDGSSTGAIAAATGTTLTLAGQAGLSGAIVQFGTATDTGTINAAFAGGYLAGAQRLLIGGGIFRAAGIGVTNLLIGSMPVVQIDAGATLDLNAAQPSTTLLALEGAGTLLNDGATTYIQSGDFAGTISGTQTVVKTSSGTLIMSGDNDYSGTTHVDGGRLQIGDGGTSGTLGSNDVIVASGATLAFARSDDHTVSNLIDGAGIVEQAGPGVLTLTGANTYSGGTVITGGLINFTDEDNLGVGSILLNGGGLQWATGTTTDISSRISGIGSGGAFFDTNGNDVTLASTLSGSGGLTKLGSGTLTLSGTNSFGGPVTINDGTLYQDSASALTGASIVLGGGTLDIGNYDLQLSQALSITGSGTLLSSGTGALTTASGEDMVFGSLGGSIVTSLSLAIDSGSTLTMFGNNVLSGGITVDGKLVIGETGAAGDAGNVLTTIGSVISFADGVDNAATVLIASNTTQLEVLGTDVATQSGAINEDASVRGFEKIGSGTLNMTGANGYSGTTLVTGGTLGFNEQAIANSAAITIDNGAAIRSLEDVVYSGTLDILANGGTVDTDGYGLTLAKKVTFLGELTKAGSGTLLLEDQDGDSSGAGGVHVTAGTLALGSNGAAGTGTIRLDDATILLNAACGCDPLTLTNAIQIALGGTATIDTDGYTTTLSGTISGGNLIFADTYGGGSTILTGTNSYGDTTVNAGATLMVGDGGTAGTLGTGSITNDGALIFNRSDIVTLSTAVTGSGLLAHFGTGTLTLTADNSYTGGTVIYDPAGILRVGNGATTGSLGTGDIVMAGTLIFDRSDDVTISDSISGAGLITKLGAGTLTLSGDNLNGIVGPYVGDISIEAGTLAVAQFGLGGSQLLTLAGGTQLKALEDSYGGDVAVLAGGATIDTGSYTFEMIGALDLQGELTKTGSGTLLLADLNEEGIGAGGINVTAGTLGLGSDFAAGTGLIKLANGTTLLNYACGCSDLTVSNDIQIALGGTVTFDGAGYNTDLDGAISGGDIRFTTSVSAPFAGSIFQLNGANSYRNTLIGPNVALIVYDGTLGTGDVTFDPTASDPTTPAALVFQNDVDYSFGGKIIGAGIVSIEADPGNSVTLTGSNTATDNFTGTVDVMRGKLVINGAFGDVVGNTASMTVNGGTLGGSGTFHGSVDIGSARLNPGNSPGTLNVAGYLNLSSGTILNYELGAPGTVGGASNDLVTVGGSLTLDGTINTIASGGGYGPGYYRLFNYGGTLTDNGLAIGTIAGGMGGQVLTNINGQVNLRLGGAQAIQYWDGADMGSTVGFTGGAGIWNSANTNWTGPTGYAINDAWQGQVGVFGGTAGGAITVDGNQAFQDLRFATDGYVLRPSSGGGTLNTTGGFSIIDVASGITADIGVSIQGGAGLNKTGNGTLILSAVNPYSGATDIAAGTLRLGTNNVINSQSALNVQSGATFDLAGFTTQAGSLEGAGDITLDNGRLEVGFNNASTTFSGKITGSDGGTADFTKNGSGTLTVSGTIDVGQNTALEAIIQVNGGSLLVTGTGSLSADLIQNFSTIENSGTISAGVVLQSFATLTNTSTGTITGTIQNFATFDNFGTIIGGLQSLSGTSVNHSTGVIDGSVQTFASFISTGIINGSLSNFAAAQIENQVNGELANVQNGATVTLTGTTTGITNYNSAQGALLDLAGFNTSVGALNGVGGEIRFDGATLTVDMSSIASADFSGTLTGPGLFVKTGLGEQVLRGDSSGNTPTVRVDAGILTLANTGAFATDVTVASAGTFGNDGTVTGLVTNSGTFRNSGTLNAAALLALVNNSAATASASGQINGRINNAGTFNVTGALGGITRFDQTSTGQLVLGGDMDVGAFDGLGTVDTGNYTLTVGTGGANSSFGGTISGSGGLTKTGSGDFTLGGDNSYTGQTLVSSGTLVVGVFGAVTGQVVNNATFESVGTLRGGLYNESGATVRLRGQADGLVENHGSVTLTGAVFGDGTFEQASGGTFNLAGFNASFGALDGAGTVDLGAGSLFVGASNGDTSFAGNILGSGGIAKSGTGTLTLTGASNYGGITQITGGTLVLADGGTIGAGNVQNDATLAFDGAADRSFGNTISGNGGITKSGAGTLSLTGTNSYGGGTTVSAGTIAFTNDQSLGGGTVRLASATALRNANSGTALTLGNTIEIENGALATLTGVNGAATTFAGAIQNGNARFAVAGAGMAAFTLSGANSHGPTQIGDRASVTLAGLGTLGSGNTLLEGSAASLIFANGFDYSYGGVISGNGAIVVDTAAANTAITLSGSNSAGNDFTGTVTVETGRLVLNGDFGDLTGKTANLTLNGGSLGGSGMFHGNLNFGNATLNPGNSPGTLNIAGNLNLGAGTILNFELGEAGTVGGANNDLVNVGGNLTLDGTLNVLAQPGFGEGYYRLFNYGGTFTDNGLNLGALPGGYTPTLLTNITGQVNMLFASSPQAIQYWDGGDLTGGSATAGGDGGAGIWSSAGASWTAPTGYGVNDSWRGQVAVFGGASGGTVTVQGTQAFQELRFTTTGYTIAGATPANGLATTGGFSVADVSNGVAARINAAISGAGGLTKTGTGTLSLGGANSYGGPTTVSGGTLAVLAGGSLAGAVVNDATFSNAGTVAGTVTNNSVMNSSGMIAGLVTNNSVMTSTGTLNGGLNNSGVASISGVLNGAVTNTTSGTITLTGTTTGISAVTQSGAGRFDLNGFDTSFGSLAGTGGVELGGATLTLGGSNASTSFGGAISGAGNLTKTGTGIFALTGISDFTGTTTISAGTLNLTGELSGAVRNDATFENAGRVGGLVTNTGDLYSTGTLAGGLNNSGTAAIAGTLSGAVTNSGVMGLVGSIGSIASVNQTASGSFYLNGNNVSIGSFAGAGIVHTDGATLTLNGSGASSFGGVITGSGGLTKGGTGSVMLTGANDYTGLTLVSGGTLAVSATGSIAGNVRNQATFNNAGTVTGIVQNDTTLTSTGTLAGGLINNGSASLAGTVGTALDNNGTVNFSAAATVALLRQNAMGTANLNGFGVSLGAITGSGAIALGSGGALTIGADNGNSSYAGTISGDGSLTKIGNGTLTLTGASDYTGTTTISGGALALTATGELGGAVRNDATFENAGRVGGLVTNTGDFYSTGTLAGGLNNSGTAAIAGTLTGAVTNSGEIGLVGSIGDIASLSQTAGGSFYLNGHNVGVGSIAGAGIVHTGGATLTLNGSGASSFDGVITGSGGLTKAGTGGVTLTGANSYTGLTLVSAGTLAVSATGSIAGNVRNQATFNNAGTVTGIVQNDATLTNTGNLAGGLINNGSASLAGTVGTALDNNGTVNFAAAMTVAVLRQGATGTTNLNGFGVSLGAISGSGAIALGSGGALAIGADNGNSSYAGTIAGAGSLTKTGTGTLVLTGTATQTGGTTISGGTLQIGAGGTTGSLSGEIVNNGLLMIGRSDSVTLANLMSGTGGFIQAGTGTTTLTGANSYTGGTLVSAGRLRGDTNSLQGAIRIDGTLEFGQTATGTYAGSLFGAGAFEKTGIGTLNLTGNSSTFTGTTHVIAGHMAINALLSHSTVTVNNGATVSGIGTVGGLVVQNGGTIAPGNSVGTFNILGNATFQAGSLFAAEVHASGADKIQATGTAQLNGTLQVINLGGNYAINSTYVLLHADAGVSGTFTIADLNSFGLAFRPKIIYTANEVQLFLAPNQLSAVLGTATPLTYNQRSAITRLDSAVMNGGYDPTPLSALYGVAPAAIPAALDQLSGEVYADATHAALEDERVVREAVTGRLADAANLGLAGFGSWGQAIGGWGSVDSDGNAAGHDVSRTGLMVGLDGGGATEEGSWRAGVMGHYTRITVPVDARGSHATIDRTGGGVYAGAAMGAWRVRIGGSLSRLDLKANRDIAVPGLAASERGKTQGTMLQSFGELGYRIEAGEHGFFEPYLAGSATRVTFDGFTEGNGPVALTVREQKSILGIAELGVRGEMPLTGDEGGVRLGGNIGLRTAFGDRTANPVIALAAAPLYAFDVRSAAMDRVAAATNLNLTVDVSKALSLRIGYSGVMGGGAREHGGRATLSLAF